MPPNRKQVGTGGCVFAQSLQLCLTHIATLWTVAHQAPLSMGFSRQEYQSGLPCLPPRGLIDFLLQGIDAFEPWCWRRLLRVPGTAGRSNQSILKEISPEYSLEILMLKLKLQIFGHLMRRADSLEKTLMLEKIEGGKEKGMIEDEMVGWHHRLN